MTPFLPRQLLLIVLLICASAGAQERMVTVQNLSPQPRQEWAKVVVPFPKGEVADLPELHVGAGPTVWQPFGARWEDGSLRQALCMFPLSLGGLSQVQLPLEAGTSATGTRPPTDPLADGSKISLQVTTGEKRVTVQPAFVRTLEENAARKVNLYRTRVGDTGLVFEIILTRWAGQAHGEADLALFFSDPTTTRMQVHIAHAALVTEGVQCALRHGPALGMQSQHDTAGSRVDLLVNAVLGDGQGIRRTGVLAPIGPADPIAVQTLQAAALSPLLGATSWRGTGAYGPFGFVPQAPAWLRGTASRNAFARRHAAFVATSRTPAGPFAHFPFALSKTPGQTGVQEDFGILKMAPVASAGVPSFLFEVELSVLQEACRPVHFFEADGTPLLARNHPNWVQWDSRTHWNCEVSTDRLGKDCPPPKFETNGWRGKDRQHWSSNYLTGYYLLTGSHWALREIENEVQLFLGGQTMRGGIATTGPGAPRAAGRMLLLGSWLYQCTGDAALLERMHQRVQGPHLTMWAGRENDPADVRPLMIRRPDPRILGGAVSYWTPWEESLAAVGFAALFELTGDETAGFLADAIATNVLRHGWSLEGPRVGYAQRWNEGGEPLTPAELAASDRTVCTWAGGGITLWAMGAVEVAVHFARGRGDAELVAKGEGILSSLRRGRNLPPKDGWWGEYPEWDAVRMGSDR